MYSSLSPQILICVAQAKGSEDGLSLAKFWGIRFTVISLALNPILYGLLARQYRLAYWYVLKSIFSRCCCRCVEPPETDIFGERVLLFVLEYVYTCVHVCKTYTMAKRCICADIHLLMRRIFPKRPRFKEKTSEHKQLTYMYMYTPMSVCVCRCTMYIHVHVHIYTVLPW